MSSLSSPSFSAFQPLSLEAVRQQRLYWRELQFELKQKCLDVFTSLPDSLCSFPPDDYTAFSNDNCISASIDYSSNSPLLLGSPISPITTTAHSPYIISDVSCGADYDPLDQACFVVKSRSGLGRDCFDNTEPSVANSPMLATTTSQPLAAQALSDSLAIQPVELPDNLEDGVDAINQEQADGLHAPVSPKIITMSTSDGHRRGRESSTPSPNETLTSKSLKRQRSPKREHPYQGSKRTTYTLAERRYRANLNGKMLALRDSVPSIRVVKRQAKESHKDDMNIDYESVSPLADTSNDINDLAPAQKLSKAAILNKAIEYITDLERHIQHLVRENQNLRTEVNEQLDIMAISHRGLNGMWC